MTEFLSNWPEPILHMFAVTFILSLFFGIIARSTEFCPLGGIADYLHSGRTGRLGMYFFAIAVAILAVTIMGALQLVDFDKTRPPYRMSQFRWPTLLLGGLLFGIGMTMCRGCGMKNMINLGKGDGKSILAILGMAVAAYALLYMEGVFNLLVNGWSSSFNIDLASKFGMSHQDWGSAAAAFIGGDVSMWRLGLGAGFALTIMLIIFRSKDFRARKANILGAVLLGLIVSGAFYLSGGPIGQLAGAEADFMDIPQYGMGTQSYTFIRPMGDLLLAATNPVPYIVTFGLVAFIGVGIGSFLMSLITLSFRPQFFSSPLEALRYLVGGLLVGLGGIMGMGCTLGQGVAGMSTMAIGSLVDLIALLIGAIIGIKMQSKFMDDHEVIN